MRWNDRSEHRSRRIFLKWAATFTGTWELVQRRAFAQSITPIADMHTHVGRMKRSHVQMDLADNMRANRVLLVAWSHPVDSRWLKATPSGIEQVSEPAPGEVARGALLALREMADYAQRHQLGIVRTPADVDKAIAGFPSVVMATEGADFAHGDPGVLNEAYSLGLRHLQLVHYIRSNLSDIQTQKPQHRGLSPSGGEVILMAQRKGMLVDLAHCTEAAALQALAIARIPMVWSHGWVHVQPGLFDDRLGWLQRRLSISSAKKIAAAGGVIGLWGLGLLRPSNGWEVGRHDQKGYARALSQLVNVLGDDHVALGTDLHGLGESSSVNDYADVQNAVMALRANGMHEGSIEKVCFRNYARVLKASLRM